MNHKTPRKRIKIIYWISTTLVCIMMLFSAYSYFTSDVYKESFIKLGYPQYFRVELAIAKLLGVMALIIPVVPTRVKEWAYAGFTFAYISATIAHIACGDPVSLVITVFITLFILVISYLYFHKNQRLTEHL